MNPAKLSLRISQSQKPRLLVAALLATALVSLAIGQPVGVVYQADFESDVGPEWSTNRVTTAPAGNRKFLGLQQ